MPKDEGCEHKGAGEGPRQSPDNDTDNNDDDVATCHCVLLLKTAFEHTHGHGGIYFGICHSKSGKTGAGQLHSCHCVFAANWRQSLSQMDTHKAAQPESGAQIPDGCPNTERHKGVGFGLR